MICLICRDSGTIELCRALIEWKNTKTVEKMESENVYERILEACRNRGKPLTRVLQELGRSTGLTGSWKQGVSPRLDIIMEIAEHLNMTLDDLIYHEASHARILTDNEVEWLTIVKQIPWDRQELCKDFLRTHMVIPEQTDDERGRNRR